MKTELFKLIERNSADIEESSKNGIIAHHVDVDELVNDLFTLCGVSQRSKLLKAEDKDMSFNDYIQKYFEEPKVELTYKSKKNKNVMTETELIKYYKRAMCL